MTVETPGSRRSLWRRVNWWSAIPIAAYHTSCLFLPFVGVSWPAVIACLLAYWTMIFGISAGYHRYFAHRSYRTGRRFQFVLGWLGALSAQMGPLWWASHHRRHHRYADQAGDIHSPTRQGFLWAHIGWVFDSETAEADPQWVRDLERYGELRWLDRYRYVPPLAMMTVMFCGGLFLETVRPGWGATRWQLLVWGAFVSTTLMYHVTFSVNSLTHMFGRRRFDTPDDSRNLAVIALLTNGEGWHNNHHRYPWSERHGLAWWELDVTHAILKGLEKVGLVWEIREAPRQPARSRAAQPAAVRAVRPERTARLTRATPVVHGTRTTLRVPGETAAKAGDSRLPPASPTSL